MISLGFLIPHFRYHVCDLLYLSFQDDGGNSIYSYETARTMHPAPLSRTQHDFRPQLHHQQQWDENSIYSNDATRDGGRSSTYYDSYSEPFPEERLDSWSPDLTTVHKRKLDELREDVTFSGNGVCASPRRKKPFDTRREYNPSSRAPDFPPAKPAAPTGASVSLICSRLCLIFKTVLMTVSCCLLLFGMFFIWRSFRCESDRHKAFDIPELTKTFEENVFGQHIAKEEITKDLIRFFEGNESVLVMVLVGWLGGGKTFTTSLIKDHFPIPENVHSFAVPLHFAMETDNFHFLDDLALHIGRSCGHSMVIFDDIDSGSPKALAQVEKFVLNLRSSQLSSRSNGTLVLITSNAGGKVLNTHALNVMKERHSKRDEITYETCSDLLAEVEVPCYKSISKQDIPIRVIPFLPLTRDHVRQCVRRQTSSRGLSASEKEIERVVKDVSFFSEESPWLSKTGCKQIAGKVDLHIGAEDNPYIEDE